MNRDEFRREMHGYLDELYDKFNLHQDTLKETFKEIHRICEKNGIRYYLAWGSLLGYIRDGDEVLPWDYDFDINVPYEDVPKLIDALERDLSSEFYFVSNFNVPDYPYFQIRVTKKGLSSVSSHVDIFYMLSAPDTPEEQKKMQKKISRLFWARARKYRAISPSEREDRKRFYAIKAMKTVISLLYSRHRIDRSFETLKNKYQNADCKYQITFGAGAEVFESSIFEPLTEVDLGYTKALIPHDAERFLQQRYGDYMSYAPIENRFAEFYHEIRAIRKAEKEQEKK